MKKPALLALAAMLLVASAPAQELKLILGVGTSTYSNPWAPEYWWDWSGRGSGLNPLKNNRGAFVAGFGFDLPVSESLRLEANLLYFVQGALYAQFRPDAGDPSQEEGIRKEFLLRGFSVPALAKARVFRSFPFYALGGLDLSYVMSHGSVDYERFAASGPYYLPSQEYELIHETRRLEISPLLGVGADFEAAGTMISLEFRYQAGLLDLNREPGPYRVGRRSLLLVAGFRI